MGFTADIFLEIINAKDGNETSHEIDSSESPIALADGEVAYIVINRTTDEVGGSSLTPIVVAEDAVPAQSSTAKSTIILCRRNQFRRGQRHINIQQS